MDDPFASINMNNFMNKIVMDLQETFYADKVLYIDSGIIY